MQKFHSDPPLTTQESRVYFFYGLDLRVKGIASSSGAGVAETHFRGTFGYAEVFLSHEKYCPFSIAS